MTNLLLRITIYVLLVRQSIGKRRLYEIDKLFSDANK